MPRSALAPLRQASSLIELIGNTPLVRIRQLVDDQCAEIWVKCEHANPGGSVKDRIALAMVERAERCGTIVPGKSVIVEPTSGNTGVGLALVCAAKGYRLILTMPESMSLERRALLRSYGAEIILTRETEVMEGAYRAAQELCGNNDNYFMPDQFSNPANPEVHRQTTAQELLSQLDGDSLDAFIASIGTGGTITGVGGVLRQRFADCKVIGVEPAGSPVLSGGKPGPHKIQGIGAGFVPAILDRSVIDEIRTVADRDAYLMSKALARQEGLLVGISTGANLHIARQVARELGPGKRVVTIVCDTGERYFSLDEYFE